MRIIKDILIVVLLLVMASCVLEIGKLAYDVRDLVQETKKREQDVASNTNALLIQLGLAADNVRRASEQERQVSAKTISILNHADQLLTDTKANEDTITAHTVQAVDGIPPLLAQLRDTTEHADALVTDPKIVESLSNIQDGTKQLAGAAENVNGATADLKKKTEQLLKPASLSVRVATWSLRVLAGVRDIFEIF